MDAQEYYTKMREHNLNKNYSWLPKKKSPAENYSKWKIQQGTEDAEMLVEKNSPEYSSEN